MQIHDLTNDENTAVEHQDHKQYHAKQDPTGGYSYGNPRDAAQRNYPCHCARTL